MIAVKIVSALVWVTGIVASIMLMVKGIQSYDEEDRRDFGIALAVLALIGTIAFLILLSSFPIEETRSVTKVFIYKGEVQ